MLTDNINNIAQSVNRPNSAFQTPLHLAAMKGNTNLMKFLLEKQADVNAQDNNLQTPLHYASQNKDSGCCNLLLGYKADLNILDCNMKSSYPQDEKPCKENDTDGHHCRGLKCLCLKVRSIQNQHKTENSKRIDRNIFLK